jgi:hypothetical protein
VRRRVPSRREHQTASTPWHQQSTWGYDDQAQTFYAQLTSNTGSDENAPEIWLSGVPRPITSQDELARLIAVRTGSAMDQVVEAMSVD